MPRFDGTGPSGQGSGTGRKQGRCSSTERKGSNRSTSGQGNGMGRNSGRGKARGFKWFNSGKD
nr:DUF5320 domain-containing protein [uncultured Carboxylicivirga sp.]